MERSRDSKPDIKAIASALGAARDCAGLARALSGLDPGALTVNDYSLLSRALQTSGPPDVRIAYLGNFTLDLLPRYVDVCAAREGLRAACHVGPFGQYVQEVLDGGSALARFEPHVVLLALSLRLLRPEAVSTWSTLTAPERRHLKDEIVTHVESWVANALARLSATLLVANFPVPDHPQAGIADSNHEYGEVEFHLDL
ncbi:MAG TPA: hypothetical protein VF414_10075, partial [Thermoanaerobaculia bacterium]